MFDDLFGRGRERNNTFQIRIVQYFLKCSINEPKPILEKYTTDGLVNNIPKNRYEDADSMN